MKTKKTILFRNHTERYINAISVDMYYISILRSSYYIIFNYIDFNRNRGNLEKHLNLMDASAY